MKCISIPQLAEFAGCTRARMHQIFQDGLIPFARVDSGRQARYADTPAIRKWALSLKERREAPRKLGRRARVRRLSASDALEKAAAIIDAPGYEPDTADREASSLLAEGFALAMGQRLSGETGPETALILGFICRSAKPRVTRSGFACGHPTQTGDGMMHQLRLADSANKLARMLAGRGESAKRERTSRKPSSKT